MELSEQARSYDADFYADQRERSRASALVVLGHLFNAYRPASIVDFGCGAGAWLSAAQELGVTDLTGLDGPWSPASELRGCGLDFRETNLENPIQLERRFDLAVSVEVAEHLPAARADGFVDDLCGASDVVLFGAAIPLQGGTHHVNEQFQSYWAERFESRNYEVHDLIRPHLWNDVGVEWWYRQNTLLYVRRGSPATHAIGAAMPPNRPPMLDLVHPALLEKLVEKLREPNARFVAELAGRVVRRFSGATPK